MFIRACQFPLRLSLMTPFYCHHGWQSSTCCFPQNMKWKLQRPQSIKRMLCTCDSPEKGLVVVRDDDKGTPPYLLSSEAMNLLTRGNDNSERKLKIFLLELYALKHSDQALPKTVKLSDFKELSQMHPRKRMERLTYLTKLESVKQKKDSPRIEEHNVLEGQQESINENLTETWLDYRYSALCPYVFSKVKMQLFAAHLVQGFQFGQDVLFDWPQIDLLSQKTIRSLAPEIMRSISANRLNSRPFALHFCNFKSENNALYNAMKTINPEFDRLPINITDKSFLDVFPKEKIVYLTRHCSVDLIYNPDDVFLLSAYEGTDFATLKTCVEANIRVARLPIDSYLCWKRGTKDFDLDCVLKILLDVKNSRNWDKAFKAHIPAIKYMDKPRRE